MSTRKTFTGGTTATVVVTLALATTACASRASAPSFPDPDPVYRVLLNGDVIPVGDVSVLELLNNRYRGNVAQVYASAPNEEPLVLLDRVRLDGVYRLAGVPAIHVASIVVLRPTEATGVYGPRAKYGAIVVMTKRGRT